MTKIVFCLMAMMGVLSVSAQNGNNGYGKAMSIEWTSSKVKDVIRKVNTYWQTNNPAKVPSCWQPVNTSNICNDERIAIIDSLGFQSL